MNNPSRNRNLIFIIATLLLTNVAVLSYFLWIKKPQGKRREQDNGKITMDVRLKDSVGFNDDQVAQFKKLREEQRTALRPMFDDMRKAKDNLFKLLSDPNATDSIIDRASDVIAENQKALDLQTFNHFRRIRSLCTPEQQPKYDSMVQRMFRKMQKPIHRSDNDKEKVKEKNKDKDEKSK
jgi:periplasmic protein CpxP/Spy